MPDVNDQGAFESKNEPAAPPPSTFISLPVGRVSVLIPEASSKVIDTVTEAELCVTSTDSGEIEL